MWSAMFLVFSIFFFLTLYALVTEVFQEADLCCEGRFNAVLMYSDRLGNIKYDLQKFLSYKPEETNLNYTFVYLN